jgi:hypothetical protein
MAMIEPIGKPRLFVVTDDNGVLVVLDEHGTLLADISIPYQGYDGTDRTIDLEVGEVAPDEWVIYVKMLPASYIYPLNLDVLE